MKDIDPTQADKCFEEFAQQEGVDLSQMMSGGPWPTYILRLGEDMPEYIKRALKDDGEAALLLDEDGDVISMIVYGSLVGFRELPVHTMREQNRRQRGLG